MGVSIAAPGRLERVEAPEPGALKPGRILVRLQAATLEEAVHALADHGTVLAFGVPDDTHYAFPFTAFFRKHATLIAGAATDRAAALATARDYLRGAPDLLAAYITDVFPVTRAQDAFALASRASSGRLKIVLVVADVDPEPARQ